MFRHYFLQIERHQIERRNCVQTRGSLDFLLKPKDALIRVIINVCILHVSRVCLDAWHVAGPVFVQARMANRTTSLRRVSSPRFCHTYTLCIVLDALIRLVNDVRMFSTRDLAIGRAISLFYTHLRRAFWKESYRESGMQIFTWSMEACVKFATYTIILWQISFEKIKSEIHSTFS